VETIVSFNPRFREALAFIRKRSGHFLPKSRFLAAQLSAYMRDDLWLRNARHANAMAARLSTGLAAIEGAELIHHTEANEVLIALPETVVGRLLAGGVRFQRGWRPDPLHHRFVCSWAATVDQVDATIRMALR
jgi:threonine aldolase